MASSSCTSSISSSSSSSIISKEWSFRSTNSSNNNILNNNNNANNNNTLDQSGEIIPCISPHNYMKTHCITTLKTQNHHHITCLAVDNNLLYAASGDQINVFDLTTFSIINDPALSFNGQDLSSGGFVKSILLVGDDSKTILTGHQDSKIRAWKRHRLVETLPTLRDKLRRFMWAKNYVQVRRHKRKLWIQHNDAVSGLACGTSNGVMLIYSVSWDKSLKIWRGSDFKCLETVTAHDDAVNGVTVSVEGRVYTGSADGKVRVWERNDQMGRHNMVDTMEMHGSTVVNALALSRDGRVLLSGGCDGLIVVWERDDDQDRMVESGVLEGHFGAVLCLITLDNYKFNHHSNCDLFVSGSADRTVRIWGRGEGGVFSCLGVLEGHEKPVRSLAVAATPGNSPAEEVWLCSGSLDGEIKIWQVMVAEFLNNDDHIIQLGG